MSNIRQQRVSNMLYEELGVLIGNELEDPNLSLVNVTGVDISRDLRNAKVYVGHENAEVSKTDLLRSLKRASAFLRSQIAIRCGLRHVPELAFHYDETPVRAARIDELLKQIAAEREENSVEEP